MSANDMIMTDLSFNDDGTVFDDHGQVVPGAVVVLHNNLIKALHSWYPKWHDTWLIRIDTRGGIVQIYNTAFSGSHGVTLHIMKIDPEMKRVRHEVGEMFERYGISRQKNIDINKALADLKWNNIGEAKFED